MDEYQKPRQTPTVQTLEPEWSSNEIKVGAVCPFCNHGILDYDGMLNLVCPTCGYTVGGCFT